MYLSGHPLSFTPPPFRQRFPWIGADLQTIRSALIRELPLPATSRLSVDVAPEVTSGEELSVAVNKPKTPWNGKILTLCHGLGGSEGSGYMIRTARYFTDKGWMVARINYRGAGASAPTSTPPYHAGLAGDILQVLASLHETFDGDLYLMGFSLGGHMVLDALIRRDMPSAFKGAVTVSAPLHLSIVSQQLTKFRNGFYVRHLVKYLKQDLRKHPMLYDPAILEKITRIREIDDLIVAPKFGFKDRFDYYETVSVLKDMTKVKHPVLCIHAENDPWIPGVDYKNCVVSNHTHLTILMTKNGGHLGFFSPDSTVNWFIPVAEKYFNIL